MSEEALRLFLHNLLVQLFPTMTKVAYRPKGNILSNTPYIRYDRKELISAFASSQPYVLGARYEVMIISDLPGYPNVNDIFTLTDSGCSVRQETSFVTDDIVHDVFSVSVNSIT